MSDIDRTFNLMIRLVNENHKLRMMLCECSQVVATQKSDDDMGYIASQVKTVLENVKYMAQDAGKRFATIESRVSQNAARLNLERPKGYSSWSGMVLDQTWRAIGILNSQFALPSGCKLTKLAKCAESLKTFDTLGEIMQGLTEELRASSIAVVPETPEADPWVLHWRRMKDAKATHKDIATAWKESHPEEQHDLEQLIKRSKNEVSRQKSD